jgi:hypothetical protein
LIRHIYTLALIFITFTSFAQNKRANIWYFGDSTGLDFSSSPPTVLTDGQLYALEGCATLCDSNGKLILYTNGRNVWNGKHKQIQNGFGLYGSYLSSSQAALIIQKPGSHTIFYIFTTPETANPTGLCYSIVDMSLDNGNGKVTKKNIQLQESSCEKLTATYHENNHDIWVVAHGAGNDTFYSYLVSKFGVSKCPIISKTGSIYYDKTADAQGPMIFNTQGNILASCIFWQNSIDILEFNKLIGKVSYKETIKSIRMPIGLSFSPNDSLLYASERYSNIYQYQIYPNTGNIISSKKAIYENNVFEEGFALQLALDGKIYACQPDSMYVSVINTPNLIDTSCYFVLKAITLPRIAIGGLPNFIMSYFYNPPLNLKYSYNIDDSIIDMVIIDSFTNANYKIYVDKDSINISTKHTQLKYGKSGYSEIIVIRKQQDTIIKKLYIPSSVFITKNKDTTICPASVPYIVYNPINCAFWNDSVTTGSRMLDDSGHYEVIFYDSLLNAFTDTINISWEQVPSKPHIQRIGDTLISDSAFAYQWYLNGNLLTGDTNRKLQINQNGIYKVTIKNEYGCESISDTLNIINIGITTPEGFYFNLAYTARNILLIESTQAVKTIDIYNIQGQHIERQQTQNNTIDLNNLPPAVYILQIQNQNFKILVQ